MIQNGILVHNDEQNALLTWRPSNPALYGLLTAFLTTILSYQAAAVILDLCMGAKRSGRCRVSDIATLALVRSFSPVAVIYNLFPTLKDLPNRGTNRNSENAIKPSAPLRFPMVCKLVFLLTIIPVINIATIVFNLESTTWLTVADARFGGISFGVHPNLSSQRGLRASNKCTRAIFQEKEGEGAMATFLNCEFFRRERDGIGGQWTISVSSTLENSIMVMVISPTKGVFSSRRGFVLVRNLGLEDPNDERSGLPTTYQLRTDVTNQSAELLVDFGIEMVNDICSNGGDSDEFRIITAPYSNSEHAGRAAVLKVATCAGTDPDDPRTGGAAKILDKLSRRITFIESSRFEISEAGDASDTFISAQDLLLLRRRRSYVSVPILGILASAVTVIRILIGFVTANDVDRGMGLIVRQGLGLRCCDSMLASSYVVVKYEDESEVPRFRSDICDDNRDAEIGTDALGC